MKLILHIRLDLKSIFVLVVITVILNEYYFVLSEPLNLQKKKLVHIKRKKIHLKTGVYLKEKSSRLTRHPKRTPFSIGYSTTHTNLKV